MAITRLVDPKINPETGHEDGLPDPRPRNEIMRELLASYQVDHQVHLYDIYYRLNMVLMNLKVHVDAELERISQEERCARRRQKRRNVK